MSTTVVINSGYSPQLRHLQKHHRVSLGEVHELCQHVDIGLEHIDSDKQKGDLMTKGLARPKHEPAMKMVGLYLIILYPGEFVVLLRSWQFSGFRLGFLLENMYDLPAEP